MAIQITINNKTFNIPSPGEDPGWGGDTTDWIAEINSVVNSLFGAGDIAVSTAAINNDQTSDQNITGLLFDPGTVRAAVIEYSVYRISDTNPTGQAEEGQIGIVYDNNAASGSQWILSREYTGEAGVTIDINDSGQLVYQSSDIGTSGYTGEIKFRARSLPQ